MLAGGRLATGGDATGGNNAPALRDITNCSSGLEQFFRRKWNNMVWLHDSSRIFLLKSSYDELLEWPRFSRLLDRYEVSGSEFVLSPDLIADADSSLFSADVGGIIQKAFSNLALCSGVTAEDASTSNIDSYLIDFTRTQHRYFVN